MEQKLIRYIKAIEASLDELDDQSGSCCVKLLIDCALGRPTTECTVIELLPKHECPAKALMAEYSLVPGPHET